jgi:hypothetical protein
LFRKHFKESKYYSGERLENVKTNTKR